VTNQVRPADPLTSENAALVLVDRQVGLMTGVRDYSTDELKHNVVALAKAAITAVGKGLDAYVAVDASGTFTETKREAGLLRMQQAGVILSDYATLMVEILKDNARPEAAAVYEAMDMPWAKLVGQIAQAHRR